MSWNSHFFNRLSKKERYACKEVYDKYYVKIYIYVHWLVRDPNCAEKISINTLLQVINGDLLNEDALLASVRGIATDKCFDYIRNDPRLLKEQEGYLANNEQSKELLDALFDYAQRLDNELKEWKELSPDQRDKFIQECTSPITYLIRYDRWPDLLKKYRDRDITSAEELELYRQAAYTSDKQAQFEYFATAYKIVCQLQTMVKIDFDRPYNILENQLHVIRQPLVNYIRIMAAAVLVYIVAFAGFDILSRQPIAETSVKSSFPKPYPDVTKEPVLVLYNGTAINLDSVPEGAFIAPGIPFIRKRSALVYVPPKDLVQTNGINILSTPPCRRYQVTLSDSSVIDLNASGELRFPLNFSGNNRCVAMKGEAFFTVKASLTNPFIVNVNNQLFTKATGTAFNIKAYDEESFIRTTLVEGHLAVTTYSGEKSRSLLSGEQASFENDSIEVKNCLNVKQVIAWRDGVFFFEKSIIYEIMQEIGRWYKMKVIFKGMMPATTFKISIPRSTPLSEMIDIISKRYKVQIERRNDTLIVSPEIK